MKLLIVKKNFLHVGKQTTFHEIVITFEKQTIDEMKLNEITVFELAFYEMSFDEAIFNE
jgi:hypothetical protein